MLRIIRARYIRALNSLYAGPQFLIYEVHYLLEIVRQLIYVKSHDDI